MPAMPATELLATLQAQFGGVITGSVLGGAVIAGQRCDVGLDFAGNPRVLNEDEGHHGKRDLVRFARMAIGLPAMPPTPDNDNAPIDLWAEYERPSLPEGLLPPVIERFARDRGAQMGVDPGGLAAAALAVCAAAIPDGVRLQVKQHDPDWTESPRLWVALVGGPSTKKSPLMAAASKPLREIDHNLARDYQAALIAHNALDQKERAATPKPPQRRAVLEDTTVESAQEVLRDSAEGLLLYRDELSGWFGSMERYGSTKGAAADRSFWLQSFNGGAHTVNRIGRGLIFVPNLSVSLLGGIQPEPMRAIANDTQDDGLIQRLLPVVLGQAGIDSDEPPTGSVRDYGEAVKRLHGMKRPQRKLGPIPIDAPMRFSEAAQALRNDLAAKHHHMAATWEAVNRKLAAHIGKYDGVFARLCVVFHCLECEGAQPDIEISVVTAERVADFLHNFLFRHALAFYSNVLGLTDGNDVVLDTANYILAHYLDEITPRDVMRGSRSMRELDKEGAVAVLNRLDAFGWLDPVDSRGNQHAPRWRVRAAVHDMFEIRAEAEVARRFKIRMAIAESATFTGGAM
ncbi:hypothetical protein ASE61_07360 [Bosea sp. Root670]|uniref:DUF3987 domain-containing protein n=1 Tax=Bosea sp. Root670 TaxID=1736583 RepID=UPI0007126708|nr:DUF3987 domain-containing protein [Bosea sp. Root670]KRE04728.1 hypothetical protein ASE61_07360 [Bosea sp. Root670]